MEWRILTYRLSGEQSRYRVAVWRELRRLGAVALQSATWAVPTGDRFDEGVHRAISLVKRSGGQALCFDVSASEEALAAVEALYTADREVEWSEFASQCDKIEAEIHREIKDQKFTLDELDEEEKNVDRLRRRYRDLRAKDFFGAPSAAQAQRRLKECVELFKDLAEHVYGARERP